MKKILIMTALSAALAACSGQEAVDDVPLGDPGYEEELMAQLLDAQPGDVITIPEGKFPITRSLSLTVDGVTIRGAGMDKSILSFKGQVAGAEGLLVTASDFTIEGLAIEDTIGDALKISEGNNIVIRGVRTEWTDGYKTENGAYGIYPVQTTNVLMEDNVAIGASDAGIYVGQSANVIVRRNRAEYNVAGIEIENTVDADVYENVATNNTGGILVFNMPNLPQVGERTRVFNNTVVDNNTENFGHEGTPVASVPAGSGIVITSNDKVEVFDNEIRNNQTANIIISSVYSTNYAGMSAQPNYDAYPEGIFIYGNTLEGGGDSPDGLDLKTLKTLMFGINGSFPDVLWDGYVNTDKLVDGKLPEDQRICIDNGDAGIINVDGPNEFANPNIEDADHKCTLPKLPAVELESADA
ncbi:parallel beta-helix domain-containing protein [Altererythrobacter sp.]|uniref:parallel beta-helix domain-containing protein n=1 Tax=Altererythrobacter sp. TaxID=1872480 RepID=UPI001B0A80E8|nr:parallel beta-helix domain-containing protein [Altererythrobacter sp.]MBO6944088.1 right-handed parallel beta-helix repeat-containing protein [Altererythrobacter sp.]